MLALSCTVAAASPLANRYIDLIENAVTGSLHDEAGRCIMGGDRYTCSATTGEDGKPVFAAYNSTLRRALAAAAPERARARPLKADKPEHEQHTLSRCLNVMCGVSAA